MAGYIQGGCGTASPDECGVSSSRNRETARLSKSEFGDRQVKTYPAGVRHFGISELANRSLSVLIWQSAGVGGVFGDLSALDLVVGSAARIAGGGCSRGDSRGFDGGRGSD